jgi:hypothetical protein
VQWLVEHLATQYGLLGILAALLLAALAWAAKATSSASRRSYQQMRALSRQNAYLTELCLRLQEQRTTDQRHFVSQLNETYERAARAFASASPSTVHNLALDKESDWSLELSEPEDDPSERKTLEMRRR